LENTLAGFQYCLDIGVDAVELDVFRLHDGELVVFHGCDTNTTLPGDLTNYCYTAPDAPGATAPGATITADVATITAETTTADVATEPAP
jgi:glycerophosphoryl diester phosphodiesterase